jgi:hypothetical protein
VVFCKKAERTLQSWRWVTKGIARFVAIAKDTLLVLNKETGEKERAGKLPLEISVHELHSSLVGPVKDGEIALARDANSKVLIFDTASRCLLPPQLRKTNRNFYRRLLSTRFGEACLSRATRADARKEPLWETPSRSPGWVKKKRDCAERPSAKFNVETQFDHFGNGRSLSIEGSSVEFFSWQDVERNVASLENPQEVLEGLEAGNLVMQCRDSIEMEFHSHFSDKSRQDAATASAHMTVLMNRLFADGVL